MKLQGVVLFGLAMWAVRFGAAQGVITTVAGDTGNGLNNIPATQARLDFLEGLAVDSAGNAYLANLAQLQRVDANTGVISTIAANLGAPQTFAWDAARNLLFLNKNQVQRLNVRTGAITIAAGSPNGTVVPFGLLSGLATDQAGNIYLTDNYDNKIYRIDALTGAATTIAGNGSFLTSGDGGPASQAWLDNPAAITVDSQGNIYFKEQSALRRIDGQTGIITTVMPVGYTSSGDGGPAAEAVLSGAGALTTDARGNLYISDGHVIREIDWSTGNIARVAGSGQTEYAGDGVPALQANLSLVTQLCFDGGGDLWLADDGNHRVFEVAAATGLIETKAGTSANGDGGPALEALLSEPTSVALNPQGDIFVAQNDLNTGIHSIRRVDHVTGFITTIAQGLLPPSDTIVATIATDANGNLFYAGENSVLQVDPNSGKTNVVAGGNGVGFGGDGGPATAAEISPSAVAVDSSGNLYIADNANDRIRKVDGKTAIISTIAGSGQSSGQTYSGATGLATQIAIGPPTSIAVSPQGEVHWTTSGYVLKIDSQGMLSVVAGNGGCLWAGDGGPAILAALCQPDGLAFDTAGNLFVAESSCGCVRRIDSGTGVIQTVAGTGTPGTSVDAILATEAQLTIQAIAYAGTALFIVDRAQLVPNGRIRAVTPPAPPPLPQPPNIVQISDAVDYSASSSPGGLVSIMGNYLAGPIPASGAPGSDGLFSTALAGDTVAFNEIPAPLLYVSAGQINAVTPYATAVGQAIVQVHSGAGVDITRIAISKISLSLFPGLIYNPDGTLNSAANPAPKGATLVLYGTGMGQTNPPGVDGSIVQGPPFPMPIGQFSATLQNYPSYESPATIAYLGPLPGFVAGAMQVNVTMPSTAPPGQSSLLLTAVGGGGAPSQAVYLLSDPPVLTGITPASPIPQTAGTLTLNGANLNKIVSVNFYLAGNPFKVQGQPLVGCNGSSCTVINGFGGQGGNFGVEVVNAAEQVSNRLAFTMQFLPPPTISAVVPADTPGPLTATHGGQFISVEGTNFRAPISADIFYNGSQIATFTSTQIFYDSSSQIQLYFDFQGNAGQYGIDVTGSDGQKSAVFNFTVVAP